jgi:hypothetical protein
MISIRMNQARLQLGMASNAARNAESVSGPKRRLTRIGRSGVWWLFVMHMNLWLNERNWKEKPQRQGIKRVPAGGDDWESRLN